MLWPLAARFVTVQAPFASMSRTCDHALPGGVSSTRWKLARVSLAPTTMTLTWSSPVTSLGPLPPAGGHPGVGSDASIRVHEASSSDERRNVVHSQPAAAVGSGVDVAVTLNVALGVGVS